MSTIELPKRVFRFGATTVDDPDPSMSPEQVKKLYAENYGHLKAATISDPVLESGVLVYKFEPPEAKVKGGE